MLQKRCGNDDKFTMSTGGEGGSIFGHFKPA